MEIFFGAAGALIAALFLTSFVKILTTLNILRYGIGLGDAPFGLVISGLSIALSLVVMNGKITANGGIDGVLKMNSVSVEQTYRPFLEQHTDKKFIDRLSVIQNKIAQSAASKTAPTPADAKVADTKTAAPVTATPFTTLTAAFLISELSAAFMLGVLFLIPFVIIDLAVANLLMALGVTQISQRVITLPLKLLLFVAVDGWSLVSEKLLSSYIS